MSNVASLASADEHVAAAARHEAGHALARLYSLIERVVLRPKTELETPYVDGRGRTIEEIAGCVEGYGICDTLMTMSLREVRRSSREAVPMLRINAEIALVVSLAGPIAEAYYDQGWPEDDAPFFEYDMLWVNGGDSDQEHNDTILAAFSEGERRRRHILQVAGERAEALVGSPPGWQFIAALASRLCKQWVEECQDLFTEAFGAQKPKFGAWHKHWAPTLDILRYGRLPAA